MSWTRKAYTCMEMENEEIILPENLTETFRTINISNNHEAIFLLLHVLTVEENFNLCQSESPWKRTHLLTFSYTHPTTDNIVCQLKYLPVKSNCAMIFGLVQNKEVCKFPLNIDHYVRDNHNNNLSKMFRNVPRLSRFFKDSVVFRILVDAQDRADVLPTFGLTALATDIKLIMLRKLDGRSLVAMSGVNSEFRDLVEQPSMWRFMLSRDFPECPIEKDTNCKEVYKKKFEVQQKEIEVARVARMERRRMPFFMDQHLSPFFFPFNSSNSERFELPPGPSARISHTGLHGFPREPQRRPDLAFPWM